jgi:ribonuclease-3
MDRPTGLESRLGYRFKDRALLEAALTHRSAGSVHNERLEFLGDAVLGLIVATELYRRLPDASEGELSRFRASLVNGTMLGSVALELQLGDAIAMGSGELKSGGYRRSSILADAFEAVLGAIYLDSDLNACREVVRHCFGRRLETLPDPVSLIDPKTRLQEWLQSRQMRLPEYRLLSERGEPHKRVFRVECRVLDLSIEAEAEASSRRKAQQAAASRILEQIES